METPSCSVDFIDVLQVITIKRRYAYAYTLIIWRIYNINDTVTGKVACLHSKLDAIYSKCLRSPPKEVRPFEIQPLLLAPQAVSSLDGN